MISDGTFTDPLPSHSRPERAINIQLSINLSYPNYQVTETDILSKDARSYVFACSISDETSMQVPDDLHSSTVNMLVGIGQRLHRLHEYGFEREP